MSAKTEQYQIREKNGRSERAFRTHCKNLKSNSMNRIHLVCHLGTVRRGVPLGHLRNIWGKKSEPEVFHVVEIPNICKCRGVPLGHLCRNNMRYSIPLGKNRSVGARIASEHIASTSVCEPPPPFPTYGVRPYVGVCLLGTFETIREEKWTQNFFMLY